MLQVRNGAPADWQRRLADVCEKRLGSSSPIPSFLPGDWICLAPNCGNHNYKNRTVCKVCNTPRPLSWPVQVKKRALPTVQQPLLPGDWICGLCLYHNFLRHQKCFNCLAPNPGKPGDWSCSSCSFLNYRDRTTCRKCGLSKPQGGQEQGRVGLSKSQGGGDQGRVGLSKSRDGQEQGQKQGVDVE